MAEQKSTQEISTLTARLVAKDEITPLLQDIAVQMTAVKEELAAIDGRMKKLAETLVGNLARMLDTVEEDEPTVISESP